MKTIWKFPIMLNISNIVKISMPKNSEIISLQMQNEEPCMWVIVDTHVGTEERTFEVYGTGHEIIDEKGFHRNFIGTFQVAGGELVFHLFEKISDQ